MISSLGQVDEELTAGLIHPTGPFPAAMRASFTAVIIAAMIGVDADVPKVVVNSSLSTTTMG